MAMRPCPFCMHVDVDLGTLQFPGVPVELKEMYASHLALHQKVFCKLLEAWSMEKLDPSIDYVGWN